tara:strand:- start:1436 stop:1639 length:204 start_codon:yes stop_codon:yes gene_type:complete
MNKEKLKELTKGKVSGFIEKARKRKELKNDCVLDSVSKSFTCNRCSKDFGDYESLYNLHMVSRCTPK